MRSEADAFATLDDALPSGRVIATDPLTSYLIPALTSHKVICTYDQHGTPNDARALERITAAREILSPALPPPEAWMRMDRENADVVLLWRNPPPILSLYWAPDASALERREHQLERSPWFTRVSAHPDFALFRRVEEPPLEARAPDSLSGVEGPRRAPTLKGYGLVAWVDALSQAHVGAGDSLWVTLHWGKTPTYQPEPVMISARLTALDIPGGDAWGGKLWRKAVEWVRGQEYQTRAQTVPGGGSVPPTLWPAHATVTQTLALPVPRNMRPGAYRVEVTLVHLPAIPNFTLGDLLLNRDLFSGVPVDTVAVDPLVVD